MGGCVLRCQIRRSKPCQTIGLIEAYDETRTPKNGVSPTHVGDLPFVRAEGATRAS